MLGAQWVIARGDPSLGRAAEDLIAKIATAVPERLRPIVLDPSARAHPGTPPIPPDAIDMRQLRAAIHGGRKITIGYRDENGAETRRTVWPITVGYLDRVRLLVAWCEMRGDFRHFRTDRVTEAEFLDERFPERPGALRVQWRASLRDRPARKAPLETAH